MTRILFVEWVNEVFGPDVKKYLQERGLSLKCLLVMDNAPAHPPGLEEDLLDEFHFIRIQFLHPNTTQFPQTMDQQVIYNLRNSTPSSSSGIVLLSQMSPTSPSRSFARTNSPS